MKKVSKKSQLCSNCSVYPCDYGGHCGPACFSLGATFAVVFLLVALVAFLFPAFYNYLGFMLFRGSIPVTVGDFTGTTLLSGAIAWFLVGLVINCTYFYAKRLFGYK